MNAREIIDALTDILAEILVLNKSDIRPSRKLVDDLDADSIAFLELTYRLRRDFGLTVPEAKGLDFHSVCVLDAGRHIERITREDVRMRSDADIEGLRKRLAIDQLRVALSRPTERLLWLDISPNDKVVRESIAFLNGGEHESGVSFARRLRIPPDQPD